MFYFVGAHHDHRQALPCVANRSESRIVFDCVLLELSKGLVSGRDARFKTEIYPVGELLDASGFLEVVA